MPTRRPPRRSGWRRPRWPGCRWWRRLRSGWWPARWSWPGRPPCSSTPHPGVERLVRAAIAPADAVVLPTRAGGLEVARVQATVGLLPPALPRGLVVIAARTRTRDFRETLRGWTEAGVPVWASVPERVDIASGPDRSLHPDGLAAYRPVQDALAAAVVT